VRYALVIPDGAADRPIPELDDQTPLEAARMPALARLAREGEVLSAATVPEGFAPGSDVACLSVLGYDPATCYTGRAPLEAAAMGLTLADDQAVYRANTVTVEGDRMRDYSAGHIDTEQGREVIEYLAEHLDIPGAKLYAGVGYRHLCVVDGASGRVGETTPPHDILDEQIGEHLPRGGVAPLLVRIMDRTQSLLADCPINRERLAAGKPPVTQLWLWGGGVTPSLPSYADRYGLRGGLISAVDLLRGIATLAGLEVVPVPGATGYFDTDYAGKGRAALDCLARSEFVAVHVEAPDEAGHIADAQAKAQALEQIDRHILTPLVEEARRAGDLRMLVMPDHPTPVCVRTHTAEPVPACLWGPGLTASGPALFSERAIKDLGPVAGHTLVGRLTSRTMEG